MCANDPLSSQGRKRPLVISLICGGGVFFRLRKSDVLERWYRGVASCRTIWWYRGTVLYLEKAPSTSGQARVWRMEIRREVNQELLRQHHAQLIGWLDMLQAIMFSAFSDTAFLTLRQQQAR